MATPAMERGRWGESVAVRFLRRKGYRILRRNWHSGHWEIDLIARDGDVLVFVEVKTRRSGDAIGGYGAAIASAKRRSLRGAVDAYLQGLGDELPCWRFDIIEVLTPPRHYAAEQIFHFEGVPLD
ncbi:MAG: YraN family protein [Puniceicoccales bacterium]|jgi:putative endonuclease|nr:YraN family protein [Puniceicoccales bacterium]